MVKTKSMQSRRKVIGQIVGILALLSSARWQTLSRDRSRMDINPRRDLQGGVPVDLPENYGVDFSNRWFEERDVLSASQAASFPNGRIVFLAGYPYRVDLGSTGSASLTSDLGIDGLVSLGAAHPVQFGDLVRKDPIILKHGDLLCGDGSQSTLITNESPSSVIKYMGGAIGLKHFGIQVKDLQVVTRDYKLGNRYGIESENQGYAFLSNVNVMGGMLAAFKAQANVGQTTLNCHYARSKVAEELLNPSSSLGNTAFRHFGLLRREVEIGVKNTGTMRGLKNILGVWENFNKINEQTDKGSILGFLSLGDWFEAYGESRVDFTSGRPAIGVHDGVLVSEKMNMPLFLSSYFSAPERFEGSFYPRIIGAHITPRTSIGVMRFARQESDGQFDFDATVTNWGRKASYGIESTLPKLGDWSDPDEKYYRQGVFSSIGVANHAGIWDGASGPCKNEFEVSIDTSSYSKAGSWPYLIDAGGKISVTPGQHDPYGGSSGVLIENGLKICTNLERFEGGNQWMTIAIVAKALEPGDMLYMALRGVGGKPWSKTVKLEMPDSQWRIYHTHTFIPANPGANFRAGLGSDGGGVVIGRAACFSGADLHPVINYGQELDTGFRFVYGQVEVLGSSVPDAGKWFVGDRVRYARPAAGGKLGAVCVEEGSPGQWKEFGLIDL